MYPNHLANVRSHVGLAFAAGVYAAFLNGICRYSLLLNCELARNDVANHIHVHDGRVGSISCPGLINDNDYFDALIGGDLGLHFAYFDHPAT